MPSQTSAVSQAPAAARHSLVSLASTGQLAPSPSQVSAASQTPAAERQTVVSGSKTSAGQASLMPSQTSATSQVPAAARQTVPADSTWQVAEQQSPGLVLPSSQASPVSRMPSPQVEGIDPARLARP